MTWNQDFCSSKYKVKIIKSRKPEIAYEEFLIYQIYLLRNLYKTYSNFFKKTIDIRKKACIIVEIKIKEYIMEEPDILRWKIQRAAVS